MSQIRNLINNAEIYICISCDISTYHAIPVVEGSIVADVPAELLDSPRRRCGTHFPLRFIHTLSSPRLTATSATSPAIDRFTVLAA